MKRLLILALACLGPAAWAGQASAEVSACFTPGENCAQFIVRQIDAAKSELLVQTYGFTNVAILNAIARAKERGVFVWAILDKSNKQARYAHRIESSCIEVQIDSRSGIAHNKVLVIDGRHVITGSFNFTKNAQKRNAENVLLIANDPELAPAFRCKFRPTRVGGTAVRIQALSLSACRLHQVRYQSSCVEGRRVRCAPLMMQLSPPGELNCLGCHRQSREAQKGGGQLGMPPIPRAAILEPSSTRHR